MTNEQLMEALQCCAEGEVCALYCPYHDECNENTVVCTTNLLRDTLAYIERLQRDISDLTEEIDSLLSQINSLEARLVSQDPRWIPHDTKFNGRSFSFHCSNCGEGLAFGVPVDPKTVAALFPYCHKCGESMKEGK